MDPKLVKDLLDALVADDAEAIKAAATALLAGVAAPGSEPPPADPAIDALNADPEPPPVKLAALTAVRDLTGVAGLAEAVALLTAWKADRDAAANQANVFEEASRFGLVSELVKLNVETPATAYTGDGKERKLVARLSAEPVAELRARVGILRAARGTAEPARPPESGLPETPAGGKLIALSSGQTIAVSASEIKNCEESGASLELYAANKAARAAARKVK